MKDRKEGRESIFTGRKKSSVSLAIDKAQNENKSYLSSCPC